MSACTAVIEHLPTGSHIVAPKVMYHGVLAQIQNYAANGRVTVSYYTAGNLAELESAVAAQPTTLVWVETPNNPNWEVTDIKAAADIAHAAGAKLVADCTGTPPSMTKALDFGADISFHSATKYLNGHSDITAGVLSVRETGKYWDDICMVRKLHGTALHSFDAWLLIRGMRTLFLRVERSCKNAMAIATHFEGHPLLEAVLYPGLASDPGHEVAKRQTNGQFGGMMSIIVKGTEQTAIDTTRFCELFYPATSLGGVESLVEHRKTVSGDGFPVHPRLLRLSIGIEDADDLIYDIEQALTTGQSARLALPLAQPRTDDEQTRDQQDQPTWQQWCQAHLAHFERVAWCQSDPTTPCCGASLAHVAQGWQAIFNPMRTAASGLDHRGQDVVRRNRIHKLARGGGAKANNGVLIAIAKAIQANL